MSIFLRNTRLRRECGKVLVALGGACECLLICGWVLLYYLRCLAYGPRGVAVRWLSIWRTQVLHETWRPCQGRSLSGGLIREAGLCLSYGPFPLFSPVVGLTYD